MSTYLLSDAPLSPWQKFLHEAIEELSQHRIKGIALIALPENYASDDGYTMSNYYNMNLLDLQVAAAQIQGDIIDRTVKANLRSYLAEIEQEEEEGEDWPDT